MEIKELLEAYQKAKKQMKSSCVLVVGPDKLFEQFQTAMGGPSEKVNNLYIFGTPVFHCHDWNTVPIDIMQKYDLLTIVERDGVIVFDKKEWLREYNANLMTRVNEPSMMYRGEPGWRTHNPLGI